MTTPKPQGQVIVAEVTIESATKRRRKMGNGEVVEWALKLFVPSLGIKKYSTPTSMPSEWAQDLIAGETHMARLSRGRLQNDRDGQPKEGKYDSDYWWDIAEWDTAEVPIAPDPRETVSHQPPGSQDEYRRSKIEMRWTKALGMATQMLALGVDDEGTRQQVATLAMWYYEQLAAGPHYEMPQDDATLDAELAAALEPLIAPAVPQIATDPRLALKPSRTTPAVPAQGDLCRIAEHGGKGLKLVTGDPRPKHPIYVRVDGKEVFDRWCYGA